MGEHLPCKQGVKSSNHSSLKSVSQKRLESAVENIASMLDAEVAKQLLMRYEASLLYLENFIQKILMKMIFYQDIREYRKQSLRPNQTNESSRSKQFDRVIKRKDPVSNAIETSKRGQARKSAGWMPWH